MNIINYTLKSNTRESIRQEITNLFLQEKPGFDINTKQVVPTKYRYNVEFIEDYIIYLQRPAWLNKGFDFIVNVDNLYFKINDGRRHKNPSHLDITTILTTYKNTHNHIYDDVKILIKDIYECKCVDIATNANTMPPFINYNNEQIPIAVILYCIKWLFIEQDLTYWNYSGRYKLFNYLIESALI